MGSAGTDLESPTPAGITAFSELGHSSQRTWSHFVFQSRMGAPTFKEAIQTGDKMLYFKDRKSLQTLNRKDRK